MYYDFNPESDLLTGKGLVIGGSHTISQVNSDVHYGDLSAVLLQNSPFWGHWIRTPELSIALLDEWEDKIERLAHGYDPGECHVHFGCAYLDAGADPAHPGDHGQAVPWRKFGRRSNSIFTAASPLRPTRSNSAS